MQGTQPTILDWYRTITCVPNPHRPPLCSPMETSMPATVRAPINCMRAGCVKRTIYLRPPQVGDDGSLMDGVYVSGGKSQGFAARKQRGGSRFTLMDEPEGPAIIGITSPVAVDVHAKQRITQPSARTGKEPQKPLLSALPHCPQSPVATASSAQARHAIRKPVIAVRPSLQPAPTPADSSSPPVSVGCVATPIRIPPLPASHNFTEEESMLHQDGPVCR
jgi:hypothetical protein